MYMRKLLLLIIAMAVYQTISGQQIDQSNNRYRNCDVLEKNLVTVIGFDLNSKKGIWSLEDAELSEGTFNAKYSTETDTMRAVERGDRTYYSQDRGSVSIIGSENFMELMNYDMPETWLKFPMQLGDSISGYFNGTGPYCERLFMRRFGTYLTVADAVGKLVLPEGDTLRHVLRLHTERHVSIRLAPIDTMKCKIPIFTVDSIVRNMAADSVKNAGRHISLVCRWLSISCVGSLCVEPEREAINGRCLLLLSRRATDSGLRRGERGCT